MKREVKETPIEAQGWTTQRGVRVSEERGGGGGPSRRGSRLRRESRSVLIHSVDAHAHTYNTLRSRWDPFVYILYSRSRS